MRRPGRGGVSCAAWLVFGATFAACEGGAARPADDTPLDPRVSTDGAVALANLFAQIAGRTAALERRPHDAELRRSAVELVLARAHFAGKPSDFGVALEHVADAERVAPTAPETLLLRARVLSALHEFEAAREALERGAELGADVGPGANVTNAVAVGDGLEAALEDARTDADRWPSFETFIALAAVEGALGRFDDADAHFVAAAAASPDVSPFPLAYVAFQRGVMWAEMADRADLAAPLYREAVRRVPAYAQANVHLAELEALGGETLTAIDRLRRVALGPPDGVGAEDPEPIGYLGELLIEQGAVAEGRAYVAEAAARYEVLLARYPSAFADHGAEFYAGVGDDPGRGLALALGNLERRKNARAFIVALEAAVAADAFDTVCTVAAEARRLGLPSPSLDATLDATASDCR